MRGSARLTIAVAVAAGALAPVAAGAPAGPVEPADDSTVTTLRPTLRWTEGSSPATIARYEVLIRVGNAAPVEVLEVPGDTLSGTPTVDLPDDTTLQWYVRLVRTFGGLTETTQNRDRFDLTVATPLLPPVIQAGPEGPTNARTPAFAWTGTRTDSRWELLDANGAGVQQDESPTASGQVAMTALPDGLYTFRVRQRTSQGTLSPPAVRSFTVDTVAPPALSVRASASTSVASTPSFAWTGIEPGATATWRITGAGSAVVRGPVETIAGGVSPGALPPGSYVLEARQTDAAGNSSPWASEPFAVLPATGGTATRAQGTALPSINPKRLSPRRGARVSSRRPVLRWKRPAGSTRLYNLQVFRVGKNNASLVKVLSVFPRTTRYRLPPRARLTRGACYVWRVWPFRGARFTARPLGVSSFCVAKPQRRS